MIDYLKNNVGKIIACLFIIGLGILMISKTFGSNTVDEKDDTDTSSITTSTTEDEEDEEEELMSGTHHVKISVKKMGDIIVELDADTAPITVTNFINLVNEKFYDGLTFHRIISGFMIQGGDPTGTGMGGSDETIKGEFSLNGVENNISHVRGVISMARSSSYDSASSQFFIVQKDSTYLDGSYAAFGKVTQGMDVVDKIVKSVKGKTGSNGELDSEDQPVITSIVQID